MDQMNQYFDEMQYQLQKAETEVKNLSGGSIAAIVLGTLAGAALLGLIIWGIVAASQPPKSKFSYLCKEGYPNCQKVEGRCEKGDEECFPNEEACLEAGCEPVKIYYGCDPAAKKCIATEICSQSDLMDGICFETQEECEEAGCPLTQPEIKFQCEGEGEECVEVDATTCEEQALASDGEYACFDTLEECTAAGCLAPGQ